jgi:hypothetical protein
MRYSSNRARTGKPGDATQRESRDALHALTILLDDIANALTKRERGRIERLMRDPLATHVPRAIREELLAIARNPDGFRAPIRFLRFRHLMMQLDAAGEGLPGVQMELPLDER